jgi:hypothetical protein
MNKAAARLLHLCPSSTAISSDVGAHAHPKVIGSRTHGMEMELQSLGASCGEKYTRESKRTRRTTKEKIEAHTINKKENVAEEVWKSVWN